MALEDRIVGWFEDGETRGRMLRWGWLLSFLFMMLGYVVILYTLFL